MPAGSQLQLLLRETVRKLPVFHAVGEIAVAEFDDHVDIMRGDIAATYIAIIIVYPVKLADDAIFHTRAPYVKLEGSSSRMGKVKRARQLTLLTAHAIKKE